MMILGTDVRETGTSVERTKRLRAWAIFIVTNLFSLGCMAWVLNGAGIQHIWGEVRHMRWNWVMLAICCDACVYLLHGWRWKILLQPVMRIPYLQSVEAIYVGLFANEVFPFRAGELIRCFLLAKSARLPLSVSFASALIERIFDGVWLMICFFFALHMARMPGWLLKGGYILGILILVASFVLGYAMYAKKQSWRLGFGLSWPRWFNTLIEDLHLIGHSRYLYFSFLISGCYLLAQILPIYALVQANRLAVPWTASFIMMVVLRLSSIVPQAPGNFGSFQVVTAQTLILFGLATAHAKRFSLILWAVVTIPLIVIGFVAVAIEGINLTHLHREATSAAQKRG
jgi:glycosyltransferase 2 family protein